MKFRILSNSAYGLLGFLIPAIVLLLSYPIIISGVGVDAFGVFLISSSFAGALAVADFGFSLAAIRFIGQSFSNKCYQDVSNTLNASLCAYLGLGITGALSINALAPTIADLLRIQEAWQPQAVLVFRLTAIQIPLIFTISVFISYFKGLGEFRRSTIILSLLTIITYGGSALGVRFGSIDLVGLVAISIASHTLTLFISALMARRLSHQLSIPFQFSFPPLVTFQKLARFGSIMFINSLASLVVTHLPTYLVGYLVGPAGVSIYSLANTVTLRAHSLINAGTEVLFPFASQSENIGQLLAPFKRMMIGSAALALLILAPLGLFPHEILSLWVGSSLADQASGLLRVLAISAFFISLTPAPYHLLNGLGRPELNTLGAAVHLVLFLATLGVTVLVSKLDILAFGYAFIVANSCLVIYYMIAIATTIRWSAATFRSIKEI